MTANLLSDDELRAAMSRLAEREQIANMAIDPIGMEPDSEDSVVVARHIAALTEKLAAADNPEFDATDAAHPAWWRGHDHTTAVFCQHVTEILDGKDDGKGSNHEPWGTVRRRLLDAVDRLAAAATLEPAGEK